MGFTISEATIARYMQEIGLRSKVKKKYKRATISDHSKPKTRNHLLQDFQVQKPNKVWLGDITHIHTKEGWLCLYAVLNLCTRKIVGWTLVQPMYAEHMVRAVEIAIQRQRPKDCLLFHSDQGSQYPSDLMHEKANAHSIVLSMSRRGNCWDNAPMKSFFHLLKTKLVYHKVFKTQSEAEAKIFEWIECFYNRERIHSSIGYKTTVAREAELMLAA